MNVVKPRRMWIDGVSFAVKKRNRDYMKVTGEGDVKKVKIASSVAERNAENINDEDESAPNFVIEPQENGKLSTKFHLPPYYYKKINEKYFDVIKLLSTNTQTEIIVPQKLKTKEELLVTGGNKSKVAEARNEIHSIVSEIRDSAMALQFIALPVQSEEIRNNFNIFKEQILKENIPGIHESIFQSVLKLHLTVVVFSLMEESEKSEAIKTLNDYKIDILEPLIKRHGPLTINLKGIDCMNNNHTKVNILYAKPAIPEKQSVDLQKLVNGIAEYFNKRGLVQRYQENVKLHVTLLNTKYRKDPQGPPRRWPKRQTFDATKIMEKFGDFDFGSCDLGEIRLSLISTVGEDGFYESLSSISA